MRIESVSLLVLAAFALAACEGTPTTGSSASNASLGLCGLACPDPVVAGDPTPPVVTPDPNDPDNPNVGNPTVLNPATTDVTIALESAVLKSPAEGSRSVLTQTAGSPNTARLQIDTRTANNSNWPIPKTMNEYVFGTNATLGTGLGGTYKEYRILTADESGTALDEELQVWNWTHSYGTQYRDVGGGSEARRQAWSFGGNRTAAMPVAGTANYTGEYGATSKTWNWIDDTDPGKTITANNSWRVQGTSDIDANFGAGGTITGRLTPGTWTAFQTLGGASGDLTVNAGATLDPNWVSFMNDDVVLAGTITGNTVTGTASLDPAAGWVSGTNPMYAGFFGPVGPGNEITGVYNFLAVGPAPIGGEPPICCDRRGYVQQSGIFNAQD